MKNYNSSDWEIIETVGNDGQLINEYRLEGVRAVRHVLNSHKARRLGGFSLIDRDLQNIKTWIRQINTLQASLPPIVRGKAKQRRTGDPDTNEMIKGLFVAMLATYGKLYPPAKGRFVFLDPWIIKDSAKKQVHSTLMEYRHNFAAHSGEERTERCDAVAVVAFLPKVGFARLLACEVSQPSSWGTDYFGSVSSLVDDLLMYVKRKRDEIYAEVKTEELNDLAVHSIIDLYVKSGVWK